ncbi:hypothetical protein GCM10010254_45070 [Streptomyces chromofuscus]|nr:hypothetical protein GCM10010254_45070 [Streptomyces chromofuscus]
MRTSHLVAPRTSYRVPGPVVFGPSLLAAPVSCPARRPSPRASGAFPLAPPSAPSPLIRTRLRTPPRPPARKLCDEPVQGVRKLPDMHRKGVRKVCDTVEVWWRNPRAVPSVPGVHGPHIGLKAILEPRIATMGSPEPDRGTRIAHEEPSCQTRPST